MTIPDHLVVVGTGRENLRSGSRDAAVGAIEFDRISIDPECQY